MTPVMQEYKHDPERGVYGDCHRAAWASILDLPIEEVPHFAHDGCDEKEFHRRCGAWVRSRGLRPIHMIFDGRDNTLDAVLDSIDVLNPGCVFLLGVTSSNGTGHTVVAGSGRVLHNPNDSTIAGPMSDGYYWITFVGAEVW